MKLYLGAGRKRLCGYVHVDIAACDGIDVVHDLDQVPWPWDDDSIEAIVAEDLVEHLDMHLIRFCNEAWRGEFARSRSAQHSKLLFVRDPVARHYRLSLSAHCAPEREDERSILSFAF